MKALDGNRQPLRDWVNKAEKTCRGQFSDGCENVLEVAGDKSADSDGKPVGGVTSDRCHGR